MKYNDFELVFLAQENNEDAIDILYKKYNDLIQMKSRKYFKFLKNSGVELSDIVQEAMIAFDESIKKYNQDDVAMFSTFAVMCIERKMISFVLKQGRFKNRFLNESINFENKDNDYNLLDLISDNVTPESLFFDRVDESEIYFKIKKLLTDFEDIVFELKIQGYGYKEIADILNTSSKDIYNAISRIRVKTKKILSM